MSAPTVFWVSVMVEAARTGDLLTVKHAESKLIELRRLARGSQS